jgi:hypothetical protein
MALINRLTQWGYNQDIKPSELNTEFNNIVNTLNNLNLALGGSTNIVINGSLTISSTGSLILTDTTNGHTYQLLMVNGVLSTQQVT